MTGLLVSVRSAMEASHAIRGGAAIVDVKEPANGSLGAASAQQWNCVVRACPARIPISLALGELTDPQLSNRLAALPPVQFVKIGLAGCRHNPSWIPRWRWAIEQLSAGTFPVAVSYVDTNAAQAPDNCEIIRQAIELGCQGMLWDTYDKTCGNLLDHMPMESLAQQVDAARQYGMLIVLAGSLTIDDLARLHELAPDYVAVRGAVCARGRTGDVCGQLVSQFARAVGQL